MIPLLETERLILRAVTEADAPAYQRHFVDYEIIRHLSAHAVPWPYPDGGALEYIRGSILPRQGDNKWVWGLFLRCDPRELIGVVDLWRPGTPENRGFWLSRRHWGRGLMTEATSRIMDHAFDALGFERLVFSNALGNIRSRRIKQKTGARLLRIEPAQFVDPSYTEREIWELTRAEWRAFRQV